MKRLLQAELDGVANSKKIDQVNANVTKQNHEVTVIKKTPTR